ncbi:hypothetical protein L3V64_008235 [Geobacillus stearothermophilus]|uniref:hypothetical protein n=1 Tax=Geobacillus stearothermophilus TaxID=1422 RepID=UPI001F4573C6|nr:hypothetical protein [Geobacillus stearothermophilus]MCK7606330.1 hypothetical protein [Geobacillus stearothermophilus]
MRKMIAVKHIPLGHKLGTAQKPNWRRLLIFFGMTQQIWTSPHLIIAHSFITNYNGFPGGGEFNNQICPLHAYAAKALIHDGCRCFLLFVSLSKDYFLLRQNRI